MIMKSWKTKLSVHAVDRLKERTQVNEKTLCRILDEEEIIPLGFEIKESNRQSLLFFSPEDEKFFVVVQDQLDGIVVTILTIEYWHNLSERFFLAKRTIHRNQLIKAILISDPENIIKYHYPIFKEKHIYLTYKIKSKYFGIGRLEIDLFLNNTSHEIEIILKAHILEKIKSKDVEENQINSINWALGAKALMVNHINVSKFINITLLVQGIRNDLDIRKKLSQKYDDFLVILERNKSLQTIEKKYFYGKFT